MKLLYILSFTLMLSSCMKTKEVDLIIHNGNIVSVTEDSLIFEAMAIKDGKIIAIGKEQQILNKYSALKSIDLQLDWVYPGFIDAHCHFLGYGLSLQQVELKGSKSFKEVVESVLISIRATYQHGLKAGAGTKLFGKTQVIQIKKHLMINSQTLPFY